MASPTLPTRFVCIADTHNCTPALPRGDVLIHAGDLTNQGSYSELSRAVRWLEAANFEAKVVIAGNHDVTLDSAFYARHGPSFHNQHPQSPEACLELLAASPSITYLDHDSATIRLSRPAGPRTSFTVFGSPYSPRRGLWAFSYEDPVGLWDSIPADADIVVTHTPPRTHRDDMAADRAGCEALRRALWRVRPRLAVCGHIHDGRGVERVTWDTGKVAFAELCTRVWTDGGAGNNKLSLVDLTGRHSPPLANEDSLTTAPSEKSGRRETCVVNAAIMKSKYPHVGGKQFHKPIVVDLNLPVWQVEETGLTEA